MTHPVLEHLSRFRVRWAVAGGVAVAALALTAFAVAGRGAPLGPDAEGPALNIAVVAPVEPDVQPGDVMDVGRLNNGFDGKLPESVEQASPDAGFHAEQPAYVEGEQGWRIDDRPGNYVRPGPAGDPYGRQPRGYDRPSAAPRNAPPVPQREAYRGETYRERPMSFGFDRPQPDWRAEREARRAALDAQERERNARRERRYSSSGDRSTDGAPY